MGNLILARNIEMNKNYYVTLTGSKNNAGDFLIKYRAFKLFEKFRPDRKIIDYNGWEAIDDDRLEIINKSKALILLGGPGLVRNFYPNIYKLRNNLDDIKVPIIMMGIGWKDQNGSWEDTYDYPLTQNSLKLLNRIENSGYYSSVRGYHTLNVLQIKGYKKFLMTGCPAYYDVDYFGKSIENKEIKKIAFSLGVSFIRNNNMLKQMQDLILSLKNKFKGKKFEVVFHHSLDKKEVMSIYGRSHKKHMNEHLKFVKWLEYNKIDYIDISGSAENLVNYYNNIDLHIGYRVHAHIFMSSIRKFSILLSEDGRGKEVAKTIGGIVIDAYKKSKKDLISKVLNRLFDNFSTLEENKFLKNELFNSLDYEKMTNFIRLNGSFLNIDNNFSVMKYFLKQLP